MRGEWLMIVTWLTCGTLPALGQEASSPTEPGPTDEIIPSPTSDEATPNVPEDSPDAEFDLPPDDDASDAAPPPQEPPPATAPETKAPAGTVIGKPKELNLGLQKFVPTPTIITRQELHEWDRHVRGFRADHNFAFSAGVTSGNWRVKSFGTIDERRFANSGLYNRFQYSFHLPIYHGFGYMLGSGAGYIYETADSRRPFKPVAAWQYPGVLAGFVLNMSSVLRWTVGIEAYLERHNGIEERDGEGESFDVHVTLQVYDASTTFDIFYDLAWAVRIEAHMRRAEFNRPTQPDPSTPETEKVNASITKEDQWLGVGLVYHLI